MKYNFKKGEQVEIYRTPVDGLGVEVSELPPVGSKGIVNSRVLTYDVEEKNYPYVYIDFKREDNSVINWAIPCSCLKRVKPYKIIKVPALVDCLGPTCLSEDGTKYCNYFFSGCQKIGVFPCCIEESIIYLKVVNET